MADDRICRPRGGCFGCGMCTDSYAVIARSPTNKLHVTHCGHFICKECLDKGAQTAKGHCPRCHWDFTKLGFDPLSKWHTEVLM